MEIRRGRESDNRNGRQHEKRREKERKVSMRKVSVYRVLVIVVEPLSPLHLRQ
jgi:hypothetical protein